MIPKKIHYCWFGGRDLPGSALKCIESWKTMMPDAEIVRWDESNYDVNKYKYTREAYQEKKYAFVSDVARLEILYQYGGLYLDTDVELVKSLKPLLLGNGFFGFQSKSADGLFYPNTGIGFASIKGNAILKEMINEYERIPFIKQDGTLDTLSCPTRNSKVLVNKGLRLDNTLQVIDGMTIYPMDYFCPIDEITGKKIITVNTFSIHHFDASWLDANRQRKNKMRKLLGPTIWNLLKKIAK